MAVALSPQVQAFLKGKVLAHVATVMKDGSPQVTPVWVDTDGTHVLINTSEGRVKTRNLRRDSRVALSITDPVNFFRMVVVRGKVVNITAEGADDHIHQLSLKYTGNRYSLRPADRRVKIAIEPVRVLARGL